MKKIKRFFLVMLFLIPFLLGGCREAIPDPYNQADFTVSSSNCWPCIMYMYAFKSLHNAINGTLDKVAQNSLIILEISLLFWLLFKVGNIVFSIAMPDMKKQLAPILTVLFKALITIIFLTNTQFFYDFFGKMLIQPIGAAFLSLSGQMLSAPVKDIAGVDEIVIFGSSLEDEIKLLIANWDKVVGISPNDPNMFGEIPSKVIQIVYVIYSSLCNGFGLAYQLFSLHHWSAFVAAILLLFSLYWLILMVPLFLVEAFIKMGMILLLMPLFMVGWVFTFPKDVVKKVAHSLFSGFFDILFNCIYIAFFVTLLRIYDNNSLHFLYEPNGMTATGSLRGEAAEFGTNYILLLGITFVMITLSNHVQEFSNHFFEGSEKSNVLAVVKSIRDYAIKALKVAVSLATNLATTVASAAAEGTKKLAEKGKGEKEE